MSPGGLGTAFLHSHSSHLCQQALVSLRTGHKIRKLENAKRETAHFEEMFRKIICLNSL